jgi:hypothetical protein
MKSLLDEMNNHKVKMFFTLSHIIGEAARFVLEEIYGNGEDKKGSLGNIVEIYDEKKQQLLNNKPEMTEDDAFDYIEKQYIPKHHDEFYSLDWITKISSLESLFAPIWNEQKYDEFIHKIQKLNGEPAGLEEKLFFLSGAWRFYREIQAANLLTDEALSYIIIIDREIAYIREEVAVIIATSKYRMSNARRLTSSNITRDPELSCTKERLQKIIKDVMNERDPKSYRPFILAVAYHLKVDEKTTKNRLEIEGITKENFSKWKADYQKEQKQL